MPKVKKSERRYTPVTSMKHFAVKLRERGDNILYMWHDAEHVLHEMTYHEMSDMIIRQAAAFMSLGWVGRHIAVVGETSPEWVATYVAAIASGNVAVPIDRELDIEQLEGFLTFAEVDAVVYSASFNEKFRHAIETHPTVSLFVPIAPEEGADLNPDADNERSVVPYATLLTLGDAIIGNEGVLPLPDGAGDILPEPADMERMSVMLFTSGTTGTSKCVMLSEKNVVSALNSACETVEFFPEDTIVSTLPIHHTYELCCMLAAMNYGMRIAINDSLKRVMRNFAFFRPTGLILVPLFVNTMYKKIWDEARKKKKDKLLRAALGASGKLRHVGIDLRGLLFSDINGAFGGRLRKIVCGGAPLNPEIAVQMEQFGIRITEGYGITECSPLIAVNPYYAPKVGSVGPTVPSCTVRIDVERVNDKGYDEGEILVRGDNVMIGYYKQPEATAEVFTEDGYFRTGDEGYMDEDGYIFITGRKKSVIVLENGKNVFPEEIEEYLSRLECVGESVVVGRRKEGSDTVTLTAVIYPNPSMFPAGSDMEAAAAVIREEVNKLNKTLVGYKQIRAVEIRRSEFEKTTSRKIKRHLVK